MLVGSTTSMSSVSQLARQHSMPVPGAQTLPVPNSTSGQVNSSQPITGVGGSLISPSSAVLAQEQAQSSAQTDASALPEAYRNEMQEVATDPGFADQMAQMMSQATHYATKNSDLAPMAAADQDPNQKTVDSLQPQLTALYDSDKAEGKSGAETVGDILKLQLSQSQSYWNAVDPDHLMSSDSKGFAQAELNTLQTGMAANAASKRG